MNAANRKYMAPWREYTMNDRVQWSIAAMPSAPWAKKMFPELDEADPIEQSYYLEVGSPGLGRRLTRPEHYEQLKGRKCAAHLIRPDEQGRRDYAGILQGLDADGNVTLTDGEETYAFPVKSAGYVKLCDDEDLFG